MYLIFPLIFLGGGMRKKRVEPSIKRNEGSPQGNCKWIAFSSHPCTPSLSSLLLSLARSLIAVHSPPWSLVSSELCLLWANYQPEKLILPMVLLTVLNRRRMLIVRKQNPVRIDEIQMHHKPMRGNLKDLQRHGKKHDVSRLKVKQEVCSGSQIWKTRPLLSAFFTTSLQFQPALSFSLALSLSPLSALPSFPAPSLRWLALFSHDLTWSDMTQSVGEVPAVIYLKCWRLRKFQSLISHWWFCELRPPWHYPRRSQPDLGAGGENEGVRRGLFPSERPRAASSSCEQGAGSGACVSGICRRYLLKIDNDITCFPPAWKIHHEK